jgi:hypothetical protein
MYTSNSTPVVFEWRCKICQMAKTNPDLFKDLHSQVLEIGSSLNRAMNYINSRIDTEHAAISKINNQNMSVHFASHITLPDRVNVELAKVNPLQPALKDISPEIGTYVEDMVRRKVGNEVNDYLNLDSLRAQMMEKLEFLDEVVAKEIDGKKVVDLDAMSQYTTLIKEIRGCIVDLNKIRQSKQLMNLVVKSLIEKNTYEVVHQLSREYDQMKKDLIESGVPDSVAIKIDTNMRMRLAQIVAETARSAVEDVTRMYKLG